jgi:hypothetical protein
LKAIAIHCPLADNGLAVIQKKAKTGKIDGGKIFVSTINEIIRIRTGKLRKSGFVRRVTEVIGKLSTPKEKTREPYGAR